ncbi:vesicle-trafficking protein SEC22c isoform X2 [Rhinatrema bivittatum]|uniref:vesicle-trafficking protein SEC22c isoform X2 n=1 Tax=Rhinatrema bivittatum TaxID=194408 RepID=UPI001128216C|nr:vesicle-trafficking protein SEC22c isoform X2 [Rhinatrema bivittatum]
MSVILFACVVRMRDGLPLSASTDFHSNKDFMECRKRLKILSSNLAQCPVRGTAKGCNLNIHFHTCGDVTFMSICSSSFPAAMAFCFLEALHWEFSASYDSISVGLASRPYAFLEFDGMIQKVKQHFNEVGCSRKDIQEELPAPAPVILQLEEMNGVVNGHAVPLLESAPVYRMQPVTASGILSLILNIMCGALNLIRGVHMAEHSFQCYLYLFYTSARTLRTFGLLVFICLCNIYLHGLRNLWQIVFHIGVATLSAFQTLRRKPQEKQSDCQV